MNQSTIGSPNIRQPVIFGLFILVFFLGGFLVWALAFPLDSASLAQGKIIVESNRKKIQHLEGGIVANIHVKEGDYVNEGQVLVTIDDEQSRARVNLLTSRTETMMAEEARLLAERDDLLEIQFPEAILAKMDEPDIQELIESQKKLFNTRLQAYQNNVEILKSRVEQLNRQIDSFQARIDSSDRQLEFIGEEIDAMQQLREQSYIDKPRLLALQREEARLVGTKNENIGRIAQSQQTIGETKTQILAVEKERQQEILERLFVVQNELKDDLERLEAARDTLERTEVAASTSGLVVGIMVNGPGEVLQPGQVIMEVVPSAEELIIEAMINPIDIDVVHSGLRAKVELSAFKSRNLPTIWGTVEHVSADIFEIPEQNQSFYKAKISIHPEDLEKLKDVVLYPGMPVQVAIIVDQRTPWQYLISPITDSFDKAFKEQ